MEKRQNFPNTLIISGSKGMAKGRGEMKMKLYYQRESIGRKDIEKDYNFPLKMMGCYQHVT